MTRNEHLRSRGESLAWNPLTSLTDLAGVAEAFAPPLDSKWARSAVESELLESLDGLLGKNPVSFRPLLESTVLGEIGLSGRADSVWGTKSIR